MPFYTVQYRVPLSDSQKDQLAEAITSLHSTRFLTPRLFVHVTFTDVSERCSYVAGKRRTGNHIHGSIRTGPSRPQSELDALCRDIAAAWKDVVVDSSAAEGASAKEAKLDTVILTGGLAAGVEAGIVLPQAGGDVDWLREHWDEFNARAKDGDEDMKSLVAEVAERGLIQGQANGLKNAVKRLEDALGWGDAA